MNSKFLFRTTVQQTRILGERDPNNLLLNNNNARKNFVDRFIKKSTQERKSYFYSGLLFSFGLNKAND